MPILSVYHGLSGFTFALANASRSETFTLVKALRSKTFALEDESKSANDVQILHFSYSYSPNVFGPLIKEKDFYRTVFEWAAGEYGIDLKACKILLCSYQNMPDLGMYVDLSALAADIISNARGYNAIFLQTQKISGDNLYENSNFFPNLKIYPFIVPADFTDQAVIDQQIIRHAEKASNDISAEFPLLFTGERFTSGLNNPALNKLLTLDAWKKPGIYEIKLDKDNVFCLLSMMSTYDHALENILLDYDFESLGTVLNAKGAVECLFEPASGISQLIEVGENELFIVPLPKNSRARVVVKNLSLGSLEKFVTGGSLGFIIDTRDKQPVNYSHPGYIDRYIKLINEAGTAL